MSKLLFIVVGVILLILILIFLFLLPKKPSTQPSPVPVQQFQPSGIASPTPAPTSQALAIISSIPSINAQEVPPNITLRATFNQAPRLELASVKFTPATTFQLSIVSNILFIKPNADLQPSTNYTAEISVSGMLSPYILSFKTAAQNPAGTNPDATGIQQVDDTLRRVQPDAFLANRLPYSIADFSVTSANRPSTNNLYFIVVLNGADKVSAKNAFLDWLKSLQLTDAQIQGLDIEYQ